MAKSNKPADVEETTTADAIHALAESVMQLREGIIPYAIPSNDASGGNVDSLTEGIMGITAGLFRMGEAIDNLAEAVREKVG